MEIPFALYPSISKNTLQTLTMHAINVENLHSLILHSGFSDQEKLKFAQCINQHFFGTPLEYITGKCNFYGIDFTVSNAVLIPRIDTEILVEIAIKHIKNQSFSVLELCTGSGCISVSIAKHCQNATILAVDISPPALEVCKQNIEKYNLQKNITTQICDITKHIPQGNFDILIANPPYIESDTVLQLEDSVKNFEPNIALDGGTDGLEFYRHIFGYLQKNPMPALLEIGFNQGEKIKNLAKEFGIENVEIIKDYGENNRVAMCNFLEQ
jgi:release factor glutamine methyltransferase